MTRRLIATILMGAAVAAGCGSAASSGPTKADRKAAAHERAQERAAAEFAKCQRQLGDLVAAEDELDSRLDVGLNYQDYQNRLGDVSSAYHEIPFHSLSPSCLLAGAAAEKALNEYIKASNIWSDCFDDINCDTDSIEGDLQQHWSAASTKISSAHRGIRELKSPTGL